jgi:hypothetical protein
VRQLVRDEQRDFAGRIAIDQPVEPLDQLPGVIQCVTSDPPAEQQPRFGFEGRPDPGLSELGFESLGVGAGFLLLDEGPQLVKLDLGEASAHEMLGKEDVEMLADLEDDPVDGVHGVVEKPGGGPNRDPFGGE